MRHCSLLARPKIVPRSLLSKLQIQMGKARIPRVLLGTSPFIGAGQFGRRAAFYYNYFYENPKNIVKIIHKAVDLGVTGVQALPFRPIFGAFKGCGERTEGQINHRRHDRSRRSHE